MMNLEKQLNGWDAFVNHEKILPGVLPLIASSWRRCWARVNPTQNIQFNRLNSDHLLAAQVASFDFISISRPVMEDIYQNIEQQGIALLLLNAAGYILDMVAEPQALNRLKAQGIQVGVLFTEEHVGTNALGLALIERMPVQVLGPEHYAQQFHAMAGAAAPIFAMTGHPLGVLGLLAPLDSYQSLSLGMVTAGARAIEAQHQADQLLADYNSQLDELNALLNSVSEGILVWNNERILFHINRAASGVIGLPPENLVGEKLGSTLSYPAFILRAIEKRQPLTDVEASFRVGQQSINCVLSLRFVYRKKDLDWIIISFRQAKEVRKLVQRQVGASALLTLEDIPGDSPQMKRVYHFVKSVAPALASVLIRGESGTGKNVLAGAIHNESPRRDAPYIIFPCSTIPNELVIVEMLGYEEGSLPRRAGSRPSKFELAQGGTIFFQDVDGLPLDAQAILLNALEMRMIQRLGSDRPVEIDVRVIASTSADIEKLVAEGNFRADLFYRLSTFTISMPALSERTRDIPLVVERILTRLSGQLARPLALGPGVIEIFKKYSWPGNIRELESVLGRAATQVDESGLITLEHLPTAVHHLSFGQKNGGQFALTRPLFEVEHEAILQTARLCHGNLTHMAQALGISRTTLWRRVKAYGIALEDYRQN
jgi:transcriptional regulator of acetoin/glycerol metabolism